MHHTIEDVLAAGTRQTRGHFHWRIGEVVLHAGDTAANPASTTHLIYGPAHVRYIEHPDGGIDITVTREEK